jgi:tRNA (guanine37-N1)-methyltransferase
MRFHVVTIFPEFFSGPFAHGVVARAQANGVLDIRIHDLRNWTYDRHRTVDDRPFGGGEGMLLKPEPLFEAVEAVLPVRSEAQKVVLLSAQGEPFSQTVARELSIGDFVLSGGELAAAVVIDAVARLLPGVLGNEDSARNESFGESYDGLLDCPQYTRPAEFRGWKVPDVLLGGHHEEIKRWRRAASREKTKRVRPDLTADRT